jgi:hypothetical protein
MQNFRIRWLRYEERGDIKVLSRTVYADKKESYPDNLASSSPLYDLFLIPPDVIGAELRKVAVAVDENDEILVAIGVRQMQPIPAWYLSWTLSGVSTYAFSKIWKEMIKFLCEYFEGIGCNEFYVLNPADREEVYRRMMKFLRDRYWTFVEQTIPKRSRSINSLYNALMGHTTYAYDVNIRRYILQRHYND